MKITGEQVGIIKLYDLKDYNVGEVVESHHLVESLEEKGKVYKVHSRLRDLEFENKSYEGILPSMQVSSEYKDFIKIGESESHVLLTPLYVINVKEDEVHFIFNSKSKMKYSNYFRNLKNEVDEWFVGCIDEEQFILEVRKDLYYTDNGDSLETVTESGYILPILNYIVGNEDLDFQHLPYTEYEVALEVHEGRLDIENLNQQDMEKHMKEIMSTNQM